MISGVANHLSNLLLLKHFSYGLSKNVFYIIKLFEEGRNHKVDLKSLDGLEVVVDGYNNLLAVYVSVKWNLEATDF